MKNLMKNVQVVIVCLVNVTKNKNTYLICVFLFYLFNIYNKMVNKYTKKDGSQTNYDQKAYNKTYYEKNKERIIQRIKERLATMTDEQREKYNEKKRQMYKIWYFLMDDDKKRKLINGCRKWINNNIELHKERTKQYYQQNKKKKDESGKVPTAQPG